METLILSEGLNDFMFLESEETIDQLNLYADQLIAGEVDKKLEESIEPILNSYLSGNVFLLEAMSMEDQVKMFKDKTKKNKEKQAKQDLESRPDSTKEAVKRMVAPDSDDSKKKKEISDDELKKKLSGLTTRQAKSLGKKSASKTLKDAKKADDRERAFRIGQKEAVNSIKKKLDKEKDKAHDAAKKENEERDVEKKKERDKAEVEAHKEHKTRKIADSKEKAKKIKERKKEERKQEIKDIAKAKGPLGFLKRKMGEKSIGKFIKKKIVNTKKVKKLKRELEKSTKAAALKAKELTQAGKAKMEKYAEVPEYKRMQDGSAMQLRKQAIKDLSKAKSLRSGMKQKFMLGLKRKLS